MEHVKFYESVRALATIAGIDLETAGRRLQAAVGRLGDPTPEAEEALVEAGICADDPRFTDEQKAEIRAAAIDEYRSPVVPSGGAEKFADGMMNRLTPRPEIGPDMVVTYNDLTKWERVCRYRMLPDCATNIMPHYPETKVLEWADAAWERGWWDGPTHHKRWWRAKMDAHKRGEG